ncbi:MAG: hypothetical protein A2X28_07355 [Elusimicrobia bacterium GWA2_56_46]|nr:MAG: hypothetical protein A2X28_07355 [Elusimicrobia bacterium GWA2_56_46]OGR54935.1 MAG: hypothetical protein A2X39_10635 [Elusimicrobia bacterium GWC2_56_31]
MKIIPKGRIFRAAPVIVGIMIGCLTPGAAQEAAPPKKDTVRISISAMISPKNTFVYYQGILGYLSKKLGKPVELVQRPTYAEVNDLVEKRDIDLAFVCAGPYVAGKKKLNMELIAAPVVHGEQVYYSYIIVHKNSPIRSLKELRKKNFAFTDPNSNTGFIVPKYYITKMGETIDLFFGQYIYTKSHDNSIKAVAEKTADGAAVDNLIWEYLNGTDPQYTSQTRVIEKLGPYGMPPVVVNPGLDAGMKAKIRNILTTMHRDKEGRAILKKLFIDRFAAIKDGDYASVREMQAWIDKSEK